MRKHIFRPRLMNAQRKQREEEIERLMQGDRLTRDRGAAFQEELRKTTVALFEKETRRIQKTERPERPRRPISAATAGWWLIVLGAAAWVFSMVKVGGLLVVCGIGAIAWDAIRNYINKEKYKIIKSSKSTRG